MARAIVKPSSLTSADRGSWGSGISAQGREIRARGERRGNARAVATARVRERAKSSKSPAIGGSTMRNAASF